MSDDTLLAADLCVSALLVVGISRFRTPAGARLGTHLAALALGAAIALVLADHGAASPLVVAGSALVGALAGVLIAIRIDMTSIPAVVALQHGMGGVAAVLVSALELVRGGPALATAGRVSGLIGLVIGAATFSARMLAAAKLGNHVRQSPTRVRGHNLHLLGLLALTAVFASQYWIGASPVAHVIAIGIAATVFGLLFAIRIGGADMPVLISFLNATAGLAAAFCGVAIEHRLLIVAGAIVASSGTILTIMMCRAMNRSLASIFTGGAAVAPTFAAAPAPPPPPRVTSREEVLDDVAQLALTARKIIVVPGYGMALAHAQFEVVRLTRMLEALGKEVRFAIHPVAGRMPGHMNVLLAEADVDYEKLCEMDEANQEFPSTDLVLVVGACDVVNPAAMQIEGTPLSGMPILMAHQAHAVAVCNLDARPGYSGVENPMYHSPRTRLLLGDALATVEALHARVGAAPRTAA